MKVEFFMVPGRGMGKWVTSVPNSLLTELDIPSVLKRFFKMKSIYIRMKQCKVQGWMAIYLSNRIIKAEFAIW